MFLKKRIRRHYDIAAPLYRNLWGIHVHHGYWRDGTETKEVAQEQLTELLASKANIPHGCRILDVGCGFGGSAIYLTEHFGARVLGINISQTQIRIARSIVEDIRNPPHFAVMDAEQPALAAEFDVIWSIEATSHLSRKSESFSRLVAMLAPGGRVAIMDWFKAEGLTPQDEERYVEPIVRQMLLPELKTIRGYAEIFEKLGFRVVEAQDISTNVSKTWDLCLEVVKIPALWKFAFSHGPDFVSFLRGISSMRQGFDSGALRYGLLIAEKCP